MIVAKRCRFNWSKSQGVRSMKASLLDLVLDHHNPTACNSGPPSPVQVSQIRFLKMDHPSGHLVTILILIDCHFDTSGQLSSSAFINRSHPNDVPLRGNYDFCSPKRELCWGPRLQPRRQPDGVHQPIVSNEVIHCIFDVTPKAVG